MTLTDGATEMSNATQPFSSADLDTAIESFSARPACDLARRAGHAIIVGKLNRNPASVSGHSLRVACPHGHANAYQGGWGPDGIGPQVMAVPTLLGWFSCNQGCETYLSDHHDILWAN